MARAWMQVVACALALLLPAAAAGAQAFQVTGRFQYADKHWDYNGWTGEQSPRPIRRADVSVVNHLTGLVLATGSTQDDGSFSITCVTTALLDIKVRCEADTGLSPGFQRVRVLAPGGEEYVVESKVHFAHSPLFPLDVGTVTAPAVQVGPNTGHPFNLLDVAVSAFEYLLGPEVGAPVVPYALRLHWPNAGGTFTSGTGSHFGADDGYDDAVVLHEVGHLVHNNWSQNDSLGGPHWFGDSDQDPRLAFSEGFATFFGGLVLNSLGREALYVDCSGSATVGGVQLRLALETLAPWAALCFGEADEVAVAATLFDLLDDETTPDADPGNDDDPFVAGTLIAGLTPHAAFWTLFTGPLKDAVNLSQHDAWDEWLALFAADPHLEELTAVFGERRMRFVPDEQEPDGTPALAALLLAVTGDAWTGERTLYAADAAAPAPGTGDTDHYAVPLVAGDVIEVRTRYPQGIPDAETECDPYLELYTPSGALAGADESSGAGRNALLTPVAIGESGTWIVKVGTHSRLRRYGRYQLRVRYLSQNQPPQLVAGPSAFPQTLSTGSTALLSALAIDPDEYQSLEYAWTPLDGGRILGSGPSVQFAPSAVAVSTPVRVRLVVSDSLGATTPPAEVTLTVLPGSGGLCADAAGTQVIGSGKPGLGGVPTLVALGAPVVPGTGFALRATGLTALLPGYVVAGFSQLGAGFDGGTLWATPDVLIPATPDAAGELLIPLSLPAEPLLCGLTVFVQVIVPGDHGAGGPLQTAQSNGLRVTFGD